MVKSSPTADASIVRFDSLTPT